MLLKYKIPNLQNGHAYLTSHRACYVDNAEPRKHSAAVDLKSIEKYGFYAGFLKSSPKITLYPKVQKPSVIQNRAHPTPSTTPAFTSARSHSSSPAPRVASPFDPTAQRAGSPNTSSISWICTICTQANQLPLHFDATTANAHTPLPPCSTCGVKPSLAHVLKAAVSTASGWHAPTPAESPRRSIVGSRFESQKALGNRYGNVEETHLLPEPRFQCPRCTFLNHPSLPNCELCGTSLTSVQGDDHTLAQDFGGRSESPGPTLGNGTPDLDHSIECIKLSFRAGGEKIFYERLKGAMQQRKWLLQNAPPVPKPDSSDGTTPRTDVGLAQAASNHTKVVGIAGLERRGQELRKNNEVVLGNAFEDLGALMASAKDVIALAESFANKSADGSTEANAILQESATALGMVTTKDMLGSNASSESLYLSELSKNLAEYLTDDARGVLKMEGGIMSLVDLWAVFNRARGGVELISPLDFEKAARMWDKLNLPVRLRQFRNGLLVVQRHDWTDDKTIAQLLAWLQEPNIAPPSGEVYHDSNVFGRGITAQEAAQIFGWSVGVATEELEMAEEKGALCREDSVEGIRFWENWIGQDENVRAINTDDDAIARNLRDVGLL
ncbi:MAG: hypothetical protein Q9191_004673 [Dirinaria sp. TL-2023a]